MGEVAALSLGGGGVSVLEIEEGGGRESLRESAGGRRGRSGRLIDLESVDGVCLQAAPLLLTVECAVL